MKLLNPDNKALSSAFAREIMGWTQPAADGVLADFTSSHANVMRHLNRYSWASRYRTTHEVTITRGAKKFVGVDAEWAKAAVIALLRANGVTIEFTK